MGHFGPPILKKIWNPVYVFTFTTFINQQFYQHKKCPSYNGPSSDYRSLSNFIEKSIGLQMVKLKKIWIELFAY